MRIVSFLPAATEMVCALGLEDELIGITHECDYPPSIRGKSVVVRSVVDTRALAPEAIDREVSDRLRRGESLYRVDLKLLEDLAPDLILAQHLFDVCGPSKPEAAQALDALPGARVCYLSPHSVEDVWDNVREIGALTGCGAQADRLIGEGQARLERVRTRVAGRERPKVLFLEWVDPVFNGGHWVSELIEVAGGRDELSNKGRDSVRIPWERILAYQPEVVVVSPCGYTAKESAAQISILARNRGWNDLPAVRQGRVYPVDANAYFARPGPRLVEGAELLADLLHPETVAPRR